MRHWEIYVVTSGCSDKWPLLDTLQASTEQDLAAQIRKEWPYLLEEIVAISGDTGFSPFYMHSFNLYEDKIAS
jgi:hypothetical protein